MCEWSNTTEWQIVIRLPTLISMLVRGDIVYYDINISSFNLLLS